MNKKSGSAKNILRLFTKIKEPKISRKTHWDYVFLILRDAFLDWENYSHPIWGKIQTFQSLFRCSTILKKTSNSWKKYWSSSFALNWTEMVFPINKCVSQNGKNSLKGSYGIFWALQFFKQPKNNICDPPSLFKCKVFCMGNMSGYFLAKKSSSIFFNRELGGLFQNVQLFNLRWLESWEIEENTVANALWDTLQ